LELLVDNDQLVDGRQGLPQVTPSGERDRPMTRARCAEESQTWFAMSTIEITHSPGLDHDKLKAILRKEFAGKYEVVDNAHRIGFSGFMVKKNAFQGATVELDIAFHDQLPRVMARTGYFDRYHLVGQWFPKIGVLELPGERGALLRIGTDARLVEQHADIGLYRPCAVRRARQVERQQRNTAGTNRCSILPPPPNATLSAFVGLRRPLCTRDRGRQTHASTPRCR